MTNMTFTREEKEWIQKYFGQPLESLDEATFREKLKKLRAKYHPDNFEKFEDETIREMATERFQSIEQLAEKVKGYLTGNPAPKAGVKPEEATDIHHKYAQFAFKELKIEVITKEKDLKYHLFGTWYRWLAMGDKFPIPESEANIIIDESHSGLSIGFQETIRMYLTFSETDSIDDIATWLFDKINGRCHGLKVAGNNIDITLNALIIAIKQASFLRIAAPE